MSKKMFIAFITASVAQAVAKTGVERLQYIPCGVKDGEVYSHNGTIFGKLEDVEDCLWIPTSELKKSRIADSNFKKYQEDMLKCLSGDVVDTEVVDDNDDDCEAEVLEDIKEAIEDNDMEDAKELLKELKNPENIKKAQKMIGVGEASDDSDEELLAELQEIIEDCNGDFEADDISDCEEIIADISDEKIAKKAQKLFEDAQKDDEDDLTEDEAIEEIKLAIADGDKKDAEELLKFIKDTKLLRRYTRKVKGL